MARVAGKRLQHHARRPGHVLGVDAVVPALVAVEKLRVRGARGREIELPQVQPGVRKGFREAQRGLVPVQIGVEFRRHVDGAAEGEHAGRAELQAVPHGPVAATGIAEADDPVCLHLVRHLPQPPGRCVERAAGTHAAEVAGVAEVAQIDHADRELGHPPLEQPEGNVELVTVAAEAHDHRPRPLPRNHLQVALDVVDEPRPPHGPFRHHADDLQHGLRPL